MQMNRDQIQDLLADAVRDKYEVVRWVGSGGMADVFQLRHRISGALVAAKILLPELARDDRIVARFIQEARTAATLEGHSNIVHIFDVVEQNGLHFLLMPYLTGRDLAQVLKSQTRLSPDDTVEIICQVADALDWAARKKVVHRDLKPSNLFLNENNRVMVLDFGIAKAADAPSLLTLSTETLGTPYYMSPEQIQGKPCDARSDLYSLGVVFFELLTGKRPFDGSTNEEVKQGHLTKPVPDLKRFNAAISDSICRIVQKLLAKKPGDRYQTPKSLLVDLNAYVPGTPASNGASNGEPRWKKTMLPALGVLAVAVGVLVWRYVPFTPAHQEVHPLGDHGQHGRHEIDKPLPPFKEDRQGNRLLLIPAGRFNFGDDDPESPNPKQIVDLPAFYIDQTEVSNANYRRFCEATQHKLPDLLNPGGQRPDYPVTGVSFDDAQKYAAWVGKRLPDEQEWEKAARGADGRLYPWGSEAWTDAPTVMQPVLCCADRLSPYRVYNMAGNAAEWTRSPFPAGEAEMIDMTKLLGPGKFSSKWRVYKGGYFGLNNRARKAWKTYMRRGFPEDTVSPFIGFRCVEEAKSQSSHP